MAEKTIPQLQEALTLDGNAIIPIDSGIQTYKITAQNMATGMRKLMPSSIVKWDSTLTYVVGDVVSYNGVMYASKTASNTNNNPASDTTFTNWLPHEISSYFNYMSGGFDALEVHIKRVGDIVTMSINAGWSPMKNSAYSDVNFLPSWARPRISTGSACVGDGSLVRLTISTDGQIGAMAYPSPGNVFGTLSVSISYVGAVI